jgi:hypothetical protein
MSFPKLLIGVLMVVFVLGGSIQPGNLFKMEFGTEDVYAKDDNNQGNDNDQGEDQGNKKGKGIIDISEPSTLALLVLGFAAAGSYMVIRSRKNARRRTNHTT